MKSGSQLKPWHIALVVVAVLLVTWRVVSYMRGQQSQVGTSVPAPAGTQQLPPSASPSARRIHERIEREK